MKGAMKHTAIIPYLGDIVTKNTKRYQSDFLIDQRVFKESLEEKERDFFWISRRCGTNLQSSCDIMNLGFTSPVLFYYNEDWKNIIACLVRVDRFENGELLGSVAQVDYRKLCEFIGPRRYRPDKIRAAFKTESGEPDVIFYDVHEADQKCTEYIREGHELISYSGYTCDDRRARSENWVKQFFDKTFTNELSAFADR